MSRSGQPEELPVAAPRAEMPNLVPTKTSTHPEGLFFSHPEDFPLEVRTEVAWPVRSGRATSGGSAGLRFFFGTRLRVGAPIRITIPLRHRAHHFHAEVASVRPLRLGHEIKARLRDAEDAARLALVERICALECAVRQTLPRRAG